MSALPMSARLVGALPMSARPVGDDQRGKHAFAHRAAPPASRDRDPGDLAPPVRRMASGGGGA